MPESEIPIGLGNKLDQLGSFYGTSATNTISTDIETGFGLLNRPSLGLNLDSHLLPNPRPDPSESRTRFSKVRRTITIC